MSAEIGTCRNGHPRTPENARRKPNGVWYCMTCKKISNARDHAERGNRNGYKCPCCKTAQGSPSPCDYCRLECERGAHKEKRQ